MTSKRAPRIGSFVLETLTTGMYTEPLDTVREYVQNAFDSIRAAERAGVLSPNKGRAEITVDSKKRTLTIRDNGLGIPQDEVLDRLLDIGMSSKDYAQNAGFRGIGRLAGIAYCDRLEFTAHAAAEPEETTIFHDCVELRRNMKPDSQVGEEMQVVLAQCTDMKTSSAKEEGGYFEVRMVNITPLDVPFLNYGKLIFYLEESAPVPYDFQRFQYGSTIQSWLRDREIHLPELSVVVRGDGLVHEVLKPYENGPYTTSRNNKNILLDNIRCFPEEADASSPFWGWYAETDLPGALADPKVAGFRIRRDNFGLGGPDIMADVFGEVSTTNRRFNNYFLGEIHILDTAAIPNARRDGFEDTEAWRSVRKRLVEFARERSKDVRSAERVRNTTVERITNSAADAVSGAEKKMQVGLGTNEERHKLKTQLETQRRKLEAANRPSRSETEVQRLRHHEEQIEETLKKLDTAEVLVGQRLVAALDRKQRKLISEILELLYGVLDAASYDKARCAIMEKYGVTTKDAHS